MHVDCGPNATLSPCDGVSKFAYIKGLDVGVDVRLDGVNGLYYQFRIVVVSRHYAWHGHLLILSM